MMKLKLKCFLFALLGFCFCASPVRAIEVGNHPNINWYTPSSSSYWTCSSKSSAIDGYEFSNNIAGSSTAYSEINVIRCVVSGVKNITFYGYYVYDGYSKQYSSDSGTYLYARRDGSTSSASDCEKFAGTYTKTYSFDDAGTHYIEFRPYKTGTYTSCKFYLYVQSVELFNSEAAITNSEGVEIRYSFSGDKAKVLYADRTAKRVVIPSTVSYGGSTYHVTEIDKNAFWRHPNICSLYLPASIQKIGAEAFCSTPNLKKVVVEPNTMPEGFGSAFSALSDRMTYVGNHNYDDVKSSLGGQLNVCEYLSSMFTTEGVTYIPDPNTRTVDAIDCTYTDDNITVPTNISYGVATLPVSNIKKNSFLNHSNLKQITIGGGIASVEDAAFDGCSSLSIVNLERGPQPLEIGRSLTGSKYNLFSDCPLVTVNKSREITYTVSPFASNTTLKTVNVNGTAKTIASDEFTGCTTLTTLTTTDDLKSIGTNAFAGLNLTDVTLDGNCLAIGDGAFKNCSKLAGLILETGVGNIGNEAFYNCNKIRSNLRIASTNELTIGNKAFYECSAITNMNLGQGVTSIGEYAFYGCALVPNFNLSEKITSIGAYAFAKCTTLKSCNFRSKITAINDGTFEDCTSLSSMTLPSTVTQIWNNAFKGCSSLTSIDMPSIITYIGNNAFDGTTALTGVKLPDSLTSLGTGAFSGSGLTAVSLPDGVTTIPTSCFAECGSLSEIELNKVAIINENAFKNAGLQAITLHECVNTINDGAFRGCSELAQLTIENASRTLTLGKNESGEGLFKDCKLDNTYIGRPLTHGSVSGEGYSPFYGNKTMQNVTLDGNYTVVPSRMFGECSNLDVVTLGPGLLTFNEYSFANSGLRRINIPAKISYIPAHCFEGTSRLAGIEIPSTVKRIDTYAFYSSGIVTANIPGEVTTITDRSFGNTKSLQTLTLNEGTTKIEQNAFMGSMIPSITIPRTVTEIGNGSFNGCTGLNEFILNDGATNIDLGYNAAGKGLFYDCPLKNVYLGRDMRYSTSSLYGYSPFYRNTSLKKVVIGDIPTEVYIYMFQDCSALEEVEIGDGVTRISDYAFSGCANLATFNVGAAIKTIGDEAFSDCGKMTTLKTYATVPPICGSNALSDINIFICQLYIPYGSSEAYRSADQWKQFFGITEFDAGIQVSYIELSQSTGTMKKGEKLQLSAVAYPEQALLRNVDWSSSNTEVAIVDATGLVTALRDGIVDITATAADGSGVKAICRLTVIDETSLGSFRFELPNIDAVIDAETILPVTLVNEGPVIGFQCDLVLPAGFSVAKDENGLVKVQKSSRFVDHNVTVSEIDGVVRFIAVSLNNREFRGSDGVLFSIPVIATGSPRETEIVIRNIKLSKTGSIQEELTPVSSTVTVLPSYKMGDANGDGQISVTDVTITIAAALGNEMSGFQKRAADMDGNGEITVNDVTAIITLVLNQSGIDRASVRASSSANIEQNGENRLAFHNVSIGDSTISTEILLANPSDFIGAQIEIKLPDELNVDEVVMSGANANTHRAIYTVTDDNILRVLLISMNNEPLADECLMTIKYNISGELSYMSTLSFANSCGVECADQQMLETTLTGDEITISDIAGINRISSGVNIYVEGRNVTVISEQDTAIYVVDILGHVNLYKVKAGIDHFTLPGAGMYIINGVKYFAK